MAAHLTAVFEAKLSDVERELEGMRTVVAQGQSINSRSITLLKRQGDAGPCSALSIVITQ